MRRIKELCKERGKTQKEVAQELSLQPNTFSQYINGKRVPDFKIIEAIAKYFNVSTYYLLGQTDDPNPPYTEMLLGARLNELMNENGTNIEELSQELDISSSAIKYFCNNEETEILSTTLESIAEIFQVNPEFLTGETDDPRDYENDPDLDASTYNIRKELGLSLAQAAAFQKACDEDALLETKNNSIYEFQESSISFPVIGEVAAGYGSDAVEEDTGLKVDIPQSWLHGYSPSDYFVLRVSGDSMYPDYQDGDYVLVRRQTSVDSGSVAVILYDSDLATLKRVQYVYGEDWLELIPRNPEYPAKRVEGIALEDCHVLGLVIRLVRIVKN